MTRTETRRLDAADFLERVGCEIKTVMSDRRGGSYSVGRVGELGYFLPTTWASEAAVLDWVHGNHAVVRRGVLGDPVDRADYLVHVLERAAERASGDWYVFMAAAGDGVAQVRREAEASRDQELLDAVAIFEEADRRAPETLVAMVRGQLGLEQSESYAPRG